MNTVSTHPFYPQMTSDDFLKLKAVALFVVDQCKEIDSFHLFKIIYFADKKHYADYGRRIINDSFYALDNGPVPSALYDAIKITTGKNKKASDSRLSLIADSLSYNADYEYILSAKEKPDLDELSKTDIKYLLDSIAENKNLGFSELSLNSHDAAWKTARKSATKVIDDICMAKAAGASDDTIKYIKEHKSLNASLGI